MGIFSKLMFWKHKEPEMPEFGKPPGLGPELGLPPMPKEYGAPPETPPLPEAHAAPAAPAATAPSGGPPRPQAAAAQAGGGLSSLRDEMLDELNRLKKIMRGE